MNTNDQDTNVNKKISAIDRALAAAKARKAAKGDAEQSTSPTSGDESKAEAAARKTAKLAAKAAALSEAKANREARKAERDAARAARAAAKAASPRKPAHMKKVAAARAKCPPLAAATETIFQEAASSLSLAQLDALAQHLAVAVREARTARAASATPVPVGATVRIVGGEAKYIGATGTVVHSQRLRAKVAVEGVRRPVYIYTGEAEVVS